MIFMSFPKKEIRFIILPFIIRKIAVMLRNSSLHHQSINVKRKTSESRLSSSFSSMKNSLTSYNSLTSSMARQKGYSFGGSSRKTLMEINLVSPAPKYNIQGIVEINLNSKKGPSFGSSRQGSIEKTPLSYLNSNMNPGPGTYNRDILSKSSSSIRIGLKQNESLKVEFLNEKAINKNPGPGAYHPKLVKLKGGKMTTQSKRFEKSNKQNRPGPGSYNSLDADTISRGPKSKTISIKL